MEHAGCHVRSPRIHPRPAQRRNRRLFGALLGTLAQFKREEQDQSNQDIARRRALQLQRAEERSRSEFERARDNERRAQEEARCVYRLTGSGRGGPCVSIQF